MAKQSSAITPENVKVLLNSPEDETDVRKLRLQVTQLKNIIKKLTGQEQVGTENSSLNGGSSKKSNRKFDSTLYKKRHVLLQIAYFGWDFHGFAVQEIAGKTIESELFTALLRTRLIVSRETSNYHRCGRTDKGVSALRQTVSIDLRTHLMEGPGVFDYEGCRAHEREKVTSEEIDYCKILNSNLPDHIQVLAWAPCVKLDFSARFDCHSRTYKYFFPLSNMDLGLINEAGSFLTGSHDYRNFCKLDVSNGVVNYIRRIDRVQAEFCDKDGEEAGSGGYRMCVLTVVGKAFLWHQIRCIVAVLFRIGEGLEKPSVIQELLDIDKNPCRPQYSMASEVPLNLFDCQYDGVDWNYNDEALLIVLKRVQSLWTDHQVKATMLKAALDEIEDCISSDNCFKTFQTRCLIPNRHTKTYIPLMNMLKCNSLEEKINHNVAKKQRLQ